VGVISTDIDTVFAAQLLETHPDIGLDIFKQMAKVDRPIGIGECAGNKNPAIRNAHGVLYPRMTGGI
jgi:hypothetical protein